MRLASLLAGMPLCCAAAPVLTAPAPVVAASLGAEAPAASHAVGAEAPGARHGLGAEAPRARHAWSPVAIGRFGDWQAATHPEAGVRVCYAFSFAHQSRPALTGRGNVVLTVAERPHERDAVAISLGYAVLPHAGATVAAGGKKLHFYLEGRSAFAPHGLEAIAAFQAGREAVGSFPGPRGVTLVDSFSLNGFAAAYAAIQHACPRPASTAADRGTPVAADAPAAGSTATAGGRP